MSAYFKYLIAIVFLIHIISCACAEYNDKYDIYYLVVGSEHYPKGVAATSAINSAHQMALNLQKIGGHGIELLSHKDTDTQEIFPIKIFDFFNEIENLRQTILHDKAKNPLVVFYYMGHGLGDNEISQYIALGDYDFKMQKSNDLNIGRHSNSVIDIKDIAIKFVGFRLDGDEFVPDKYNIAYQQYFIKNHPESKLITNPAEYNEYLNKHPEYVKEMNVFYQKYLKEHPEYIKELAANQRKYMNEVGIDVDTDAIKDAMINGNVFSEAYKKAEKFLANQKTPPTDEQLRTVQNEMKALGRGYINNVKPVLISSKESEKHVPYLMIIDSCSNGLEGMSDNLLKEEEKIKSKLNNQLNDENDKFNLAISDGIKNIKPEIDNIKHQIDDLKHKIDKTIKTPNTYDKELSIWADKTAIQMLETKIQILENAPKAMAESHEIQIKHIKDKNIINNAIDKNIITNPYTVQIYNSMMIGDIYKKYGALFFAANLGDYTASVDSVDNGNFETQTTPTRNDLKTGVLARRFELAVNSVKSYSQPVSLGKFLELFKDTKLDVERKEPFSWFDPSPEISKTTFIEN